MTVDTERAKYAEQAMTEILFGSEETHPLKETLDRYFTPDYEQDSDGEIYDRETFAVHVMEDFGEPTERAAITVHEIVQEGNRTASGTGSRSPDGTEPPSGWKSTCSPSTRATDGCAEPAR